MLAGLLLRGSLHSDKAAFDRVFELAQEVLNGNSSVHFLYNAALATALHKRYRITNDVNDLQRALEASRRAIDTNPFRWPSDAPVGEQFEIYLLLRTQLASILADLGEESRDPALLQEYREHAAFVGTISREIGLGSLGDYIEYEIGFPE